MTTEYRTDKKLTKFEVVEIYHNGASVRINNQKGTYTVCHATLFNPDGSHYWDSSIDYQFSDLREAVVVARAIVRSNAHYNEPLDDLDDCEEYNEDWLMYG